MLRPTMVTLSHSHSDIHNPLSHSLSLSLSHSHSLSTSHSHSLSLSHSLSHSRSHSQPTVVTRFSIHVIIAILIRTHAPHAYPTHLFSQGHKRTEKRAANIRVRVRVRVRVRFRTYTMDNTQLLCTVCIYVYGDVHLYVCACVHVYLYMRVHMCMFINRIFFTVAWLAESLDASL